MHNKDVVDFFERVHIGAPVYVVTNLLDNQREGQAKVKGSEFTRASGGNQ